MHFKKQETSSTSFDLFEVPRNFMASRGGVRFFERNGCNTFRESWVHRMCGAYGDSPESDSFWNSLQRKFRGLPNKCMCACMSMSACVYVAPYSTSPPGGPSVSRKCPGGRVIWRVPDPTFGPWRRGTIRFLGNHRWIQGGVLNFRNRVWVGIGAPKMAQFRSILNFGRGPGTPRVGLDPLSGGRSRKKFLR